MIVVDSSVWVDYFSGTDNKQDKDYKSARSLFE